MLARLARTDGIEPAGWLTNGAAEVVAVVDLRPRDGLVLRDMAKIGRLARVVEEVSLTIGGRPRRVGDDGRAARNSFGGAFDGACALVTRLTARSSWPAHAIARLALIA